MIDIALATHLVEALPENATLLILGDRDQLAAVEKGVVLGALAAGAGLPLKTQYALEKLANPDFAPIAPNETDESDNTASPLAKHIIHLHHNYRFARDSGIGQLAKAINEEKVDTALGLLSASPGKNDLVWIAENDPQLTSGRLNALARGYDAFVAAVNATARPESSDYPLTTLQDIHAAFAQYRILTALRRGARGAAGLNEQIEARLRKALDAMPGGVWFAGRAIIVLENDYTLNLFNGDIGIALPNENGDLMVYFLAQTGTRAPISPARLPRHAPAWALTVHKAQGSEFDKVSLVLPDAESRVLTRELLYTGITRAKKEVEIIGSEQRIAEGIDKTIERNSGLAARLRETTTNPD